jgi:hypothetical protein
MFPQGFGNIALEPMYMTPEQFAVRMKSDSDKYAKLIVLDGRAGELTLRRLYLSCASKTSRAAIRRAEFVDDVEFNLHDRHNHQFAPAAP